jgi:hypothetical protein
MRLNGAPVDTSASCRIDELVQKIDELIDAIYSLVATLALERQEQQSQDEEGGEAITYLDGTRRDI